MAHVLVYGSLRKGGLNFNRCGRQRFVKSLTLEGFRMYSFFDAYPTVGLGEGKIVAELHSVSGKTMAHLMGMELGAGYEAFTTKVEGVDATIFMMKPEVVAKLKRIDSGDWLDYDAKRRH